MSILPTLKVLYKKDRQGVTYLQHLKDALLSEVFGLQGLSEIGRLIPGPNSWEGLNVTPSGIASVALNYAIARAIRVLEDTIEYSLGKRKLPREYYTLPGEETMRDGKDFVLTYHAFVDISMEVDREGKEINGTPLLGTSKILKLAAKDELRPKGWIYSVPHPSSISIICQIRNMFKFLLNTVPTYDGMNPTVEEIYKDFIYKIGTNVAQILPKEAEQLIIRGKGLSQFYKNQTFFSRKLLKAYKEMARTGTNTLIFKDVNVEFRLPDSSRPSLQNLFIRDLNEEPKESTFSADIKTMFSLTFGEIKEWSD